MPQAAGLSPARYYRKSGDRTSQVAPANTPAPIQDALEAQGMGRGGTFTPGKPLPPYFGYSTRARAMDYPITVNTNIQGRAAWGRVSFDVLKAIYDAYDVARMCVNHIVDELRGMEPQFVAAEGVKDDVDEEIAAARLVLAKPDRELPYDSWIAKWLENAIKYDSAPLYRRRDYNGDVIGLEVVDGKTIFPYIDVNGRRPVPLDGEAAPPAYAQIIHGMVGTWFTVDDMEYVPYRPQEDSPYGMAPMESLLLTANTDLRFQWHFLQMFTDGSMPAGFMELPPDISSADQVAEWQDFWDAMVMGDQAKLTQLIAVPNGSKFTETRPRAFDKTFPQYLMARTCAGHGVLPQEIGLIEDVNRSNGSEQSDIQFRVHTLPRVRWVEGHLTRYLQQDIGLRVQVKLNTGREKEDLLAEAQANQIYWAIGSLSSDEIRSDVLSKPIDKSRPVPRTVLVERVGPIPVLSIEGIAGKTDPDTYGPARDQPALDQPYVPPVGVIPTPGTTDDKAALAATDQMQISQRRQLEREHGSGPTRESAEQREQRGAQAQAQDADARGEQDAQTETAAGAAQAPADTKSGGGKKPVAKALDGNEAGELLAFRSYVAVRKRRGEWDRDFVFQHVSQPVARRLNAGGRWEVVKAGQDPHLQDADPVARKVYDQLSADFPPDAIGWVLRHEWTAEQLPADAVDWEHVSSWAATHQPGKVRKLAKKMSKGGANKRVIAIARPGKPTVMLADGHHHAEAHRLLGEAIPAYVMHAAKVKGPWDELHAAQDPRADVLKAGDGPKAPAGQSDDWPGWDYDEAAAAFWAPRIAAALTGAINAEVLAAGFAAQHHDTKQRDADVLTAFALTWIRHHLTGLIEALRGPLEGAWTDGYLVGAASAQALLASRQAGRTVPVELAPWTPGDTEAARLLLGQWGDGSGLAALLAEADVRIKSIAQTRLDELARILGHGLAAGKTPEQLAQEIRALLTNPSRALMIAQTEVSRAVNAAAENRYVRAGYLASRWLTERDAKVCPICQGNAERGPVTIGTPFPSGDLRPPAHPRCRCATAPAYVEE